MKRNKTKEAKQYGELLDIAMALAASIKNACWLTDAQRPNLHHPTPNMQAGVERLWEHLKKYQGWTL